jgi:ABC-type multidrug transport system fused ATPase/permease subunit
MGDHPFDNRETRIKRREERNTFRRRLLPLAWALSLVGFAGLIILGAYLLLYGEWLYQYAGLFIALAVLPFVLTLVSWIRGHNSNRLEEP